MTHPCGRHFESHLATFAELAKRPEARINLGLAAAHLGCLWYPELEPSVVATRFDVLAEAAQPYVAHCASERERACAVAHFLFEVHGLRGNHADYYDPRNSFLNDVMERRLGIPISLSVVFLEVAKRLGVLCEGVGMPGHFLVRYVEGDDITLFDPFHQGRILEVDDCHELLQRAYGQAIELRPEFFQPVGARAILTRMLANLKSIWTKAENWTLALRATRMMLAVNPQDADALRDCALYALQLERWADAIDTLTQYFAIRPDDPNFKTLEGYLAQARRELAAWN
jgi:regulator of sirC expression with transglutaminase-like and TPR domain